MARDDIATIEFKRQVKDRLALITDILNRALKPDTRFYVGYTAGTLPRQFTIDGLHHIVFLTPHIAGDGKAYLLDVSITTGFWFWPKFRQEYAVSTTGPPQLRALDKTIMEIAQTLKEFFSALK